MSAHLPSAGRARWRPWWAIAVAIATLGAGALVLWWGVAAIATDRPNQWFSGFGTVLGTAAIVAALPPMACLTVFLARDTRGWFWAGTGLALTVTAVVISVVIGDSNFR